MSDLVYEYFEVFIWKSYISYQDPNKNGYHCHGRSNFTRFHFAYMVSITDGNYDVVKNMLNIYMIK